MKAIYNSMLNSLITVEILYSLRLGSELDCKYGSDLEIKHFFSSKKRKLKKKIQGRRNEERKQKQLKPNEFSWSEVSSLW